MNMLLIICNICIIFALSSVCILVNIGFVAVIAKVN